MFIGLDASGKFEAVGAGALTVAAAVVTESASEEIAAWTTNAFARWGRSHQTAELHAKDLDWDARLETCEMLATRRDVRLAVVLTDPFLLGSRYGVFLHRRRQFELAAGPAPETEQGRAARARILRLLADGRFSHGDYVFGAIVPRVTAAALQQAICFFRSEAWRADMAEFRLFADEEAPRTAKYAATTLYPALGGDPRFSLVLPREWRHQPVHPLLEKAMHPDGDGLRPQELLGPLAWVSSQSHVPVQVADVAAWVVRRAVVRRHERPAQECFALLRPLLEGEAGKTFELFSTRDLTPPEEAPYAHLSEGTQPAGWLIRGDAW